MIVPILTDVNEYFFFWSDGVCILLCEFMYVLCVGSQFMFVIRYLWLEGLISSFSLTILILFANRHSWNVSWNFVYIRLLYVYFIQLDDGTIVCYSMLSSMILFVSMSSYRIKESMPSVYVSVIVLLMLHNGFH